MLPSLPFARFIPSRQLLPGSFANGLSDLLTSFQGAMVALAGGARNALTPVLNATSCEVTTVANANDSVVLPIAKVGLTVTVLNSAANSLQIFANGTDVIITGGNTSVAGSVGVALATLTTVEFYCNKNGRWTRYLAA